MRDASFESFVYRLQGHFAVRVNERTFHLSLLSFVYRRRASPASCVYIASFPLTHWLDCIYSTGL